jgi:hypothetical protein
LTARGERVLADLTRHMHAELRSAAPALVKTLRGLTAGSSRGARGSSRTPKGAAA